MNMFEAEQTLVEASVDVDELDDEGAKLWASYQAENAWSSMRPCGVEGCRGLDWLLDGEEPY
jgi:hypothetical protein